MKCEVCVCLCVLSCQVSRQPGISEFAEIFVKRSGHYFNSFTPIGAYAPAYKTSFVIVCMLFTLSMHCFLFILYHLFFSR